MSVKTELTELSKTVFIDRYSLKDAEGGAMEKYPEQMWARVAKGIAQFEKNKTLQDKWEKKFYRVMKDFKFVPAGRILSGAGTGYEVTFFNCYVIPSPPDSRGGIMENITQTVEIQSRAGGVGVNLSTLRPRGARVRKVNGYSSGPVNWAALYSTANHDVIQQGGSRRGALMLMLNDWHPDVEEFIRVKEDLNKIPGANLSVCITDKFMDAVKADRDWDLIFPDYVNTPDYDEYWDGDIDKWLESGRKVKVYKTVKAREVWDMIAKAAWTSAEPGLHFIERSNKRSNTYYFEKLIATNPCGEQPLGAWAVCNLGAMNLTAYIKNGEFDYAALEQDAAVAMRFMDNVVDANFYFYPETYESQMDIRRTGLGTMGLGDALIKMKIPYGTDESVAVIDKIYRVIRDSAYRTSALLGAEKGVFRKYDKDKYLDGWFIKKLPADVRESIAKNGIRNAVLLTQAPTGTTSLLAGVSSGIEPVYNFEFKRKDRTGEHMVYHPLFKEWKNAHPNEPKPNYFVCAMDLSPDEHLKVQVKVQEYTDSSISKTVNAPNAYTVEDVRSLYTKAYESGCKGITFFRDGSRQGVLENVSADKPKDSPSPEATVGAGEPVPESAYLEPNQLSLPVSPEAGARLVTRPYIVHGSTYKLKTPVGTAFITINNDDAGEPLEMFINIGKAGSDVSAFAVALGRTISASLRFRSTLSPKERALEIADQLKDIGGRRSVGFGQSRIRSLPDAISVALTTHFGLNPATNGHATEKVALTENETEQIEAGALEADNPGGQVMMMTAEPQYGAKVDLCPECGEHTLVFEEGCAKCYSCGHAEC
ncbi:ribonucleoside-diphosphate reductase, adenosylcobalamin-dependent [Candidatus Woesebacteria bacterium RIFCSPHIGHO2_01_FULL_44_21]|uniref:Vitamin B12-dependent ribonucleotide reductase n=1 Tax=Candidatus Woesebacteria bacterium RIFCSPHIGHO2_01_FULL_44_21 TaxID=1802503 RepID=A0A1F7YZ30_9BACT|nr:MAG: ribonucleoside-diphosphate reductase, adenosylcobalamin-dependent [Candidatus Woesebacteria bacterium RIFCSPHIGHO2_01_FULL_44_21]OGM69183.1 MAG: ribonucleoside-diphosphate reductase, adenosylcobalamin-dependent [Candidatus Woesebacteria bacterium RIFCSPLOWO2_01_FULL_44_24b]